MTASGRVQIKAIVDRLEEITERTVVKITHDIVANLIEATPVDLGWARANWVPAVGVANDDEVPSRPVDGDVGSARSKQQAGLSRVAGYSISQGMVFVSNNVPYISVLNNGSSTQAPKGFVQEAIRKAVLFDIRDF